ncbi:MAG: hypothetical protein JWO36_1492 [Myxococcales bacterium]|nr:hypothetical protein [Myxococcales bacterium]
MQHRKSRPSFEGELRVIPPAGDNNRSSRDPDNAAPKQRPSQPNVIAFTRPRAISSLPVQFAPVYKKVDQSTEAVTVPRSRRSTPAPIAQTSALRPAIPGVGMTKPAANTVARPQQLPTAVVTAPQRGPQPPQMFAPSAPISAPAHQQPTQMFTAEQQRGPQPPHMFAAEQHRGPQPPHMFAAEPQRGAQMFAPALVQPQPQQRGPLPPQMFAPAPQMFAPAPQPRGPQQAQTVAPQLRGPQQAQTVVPQPQSAPTAQRSAAPLPPMFTAVPAKSASPQHTAIAAPQPQMSAAAPAKSPSQEHTAMVAPLSMPATQKWAAFEKLGLVAAKVDPKKLSKHIVTAYRLLGFAILSIIVIVLVGYIVTTAFFYVSDSWIVPAAVSPTDEKVMSLQAQLSERQNQRDKTAGELAQAERAIETQQKFQLGFAKAIKSDLEGRKAALAKMHELATSAASTRANIHAANNAYANASKRQMQQEWAAGLIDRNQMLTGKFQMAQISTSNLSLAERQAEYETRAAELQAQTRSLEALLNETANDDVMSYDVLQIKQAYEASRLETQKAIETRDSLKSALAREDALVASLKKSAYLRAVADHAQVAFVPYGNMHKIEKGTELYGCSVGMVWCHKVGQVLEVLPGEVQFRHPHRSKELRGQMIELQLEDGAAATDDVLFVGGKPLFL